jgi:hypothetical protein
MDRPSPFRPAADRARTGKQARRLRRSGTETLLYLGSCSCSSFSTTSDIAGRESRLALVADALHGDSSDNVCAFLGVLPAHSFESMTLGIDLDRIRVETNPDVTIYHIFIQIQIQIRILSDTNTKTDSSNLDLLSDTYLI